MTKIIQNIAIIVGLFVLAGLAYYVFVINKSDSVSEGFDEVSVTSAQILRQLQTIRSISIEDDLFTNPRFQALGSYEPPVVPVSVGNTKPFGQ